MKYFCLLIFLTGCGQSFNSSSGDSAFTATNGIDTTTPAGQRLDAAYSVLKNECMSCHTGYHNSWNNYKTDLAWQSAGLVVSGDPTGSQVYFRLKNLGGDMPQLSPQISEIERQTIEDWITQL